MITLYGFGAGFGLPEISPFVTKTEIQLKMAGLAYRKEKAKPPASPKGQLPYIVDEAETIADSTFIRAHLEAKYGFDFDAPLSLQARAQAWAFERRVRDRRREVWCSLKCAQCRPWTALFDLRRVGDGDRLRCFRGHASAALACRNGYFAFD